MVFLVCMGHMWNYWNVALYTHSLDTEKRPYRRSTSWFCLGFWRNRCNVVVMFLASALMIHSPENIQNFGRSGRWTPLVTALARNMASAFWWCRGVYAFLAESVLCKVSILWPRLYSLIAFERYSVLRNFWSFCLFSKKWSRGYVCIMLCSI